MRDLNELNEHRLDMTDVYGWSGDGGNGAFELPSPVGGGQTLRVIASNEGGWEHLSVSLQHRVPIWSEMEFIKHTFFKDDETAVQFHVPPVDHINCHPHCLHLWRCTTQEFPRPPAWMVGPKAKS